MTSPTSLLYSCPSKNLELFDELHFYSQGLQPTTRFMTRNSLKSKFLNTALALIISAGQCALSTPAQAREFSKAGQIYQQVKDGVVTVFTACGSGSGFLVDKSGLIITNSHVVNQGAEHLRVKFGPQQIVEAQVVVNDREHDIAILRVNLANINTIKLLEVFNPETGKLVLVGEKVIAIGTPLEKETMEKTLTQGIVSKCSEDSIFHDALITNGNSGGPLLNFDGKVVGINTFGKAQSDSPSGCVPINLASVNLTKAKEKIEGTEPPSPDLLPDIPEIAYPISRLLRENPAFFEKRKQKKYNFSSTYFNISVFTPPQMYSQLREAEDYLLKNRKKRAKKKGFKVTDDEFLYKNLKYYKYEKPAVKLLITPKEKLTTACLLGQSTGLLAATTLTVFTAGIAAPLMAVPFMYNSTEVKKDFLKLKLVDEEGNTVATPLESGRRLTKFVDLVMTDYYYKKLVDKSYIGHYTFDAKVFDTDKKLKLVIEVEGKDKDRVIKIPDRIKTLVVKDFEPYWEYVVSKKKESNRALAKSVSGVVKEGPKQDKSQPSTDN